MEVDGDGATELVVDCPTHSWYGAANGSASVYFGPVSGLRSSSSADAVRYSGADWAEAGSGLVAADVDGDGREELIVGGPHAEVGGLYEVGVTYVVPITAAGVPATLESTATATLEGEEQDDLAGMAVGAADLDGDGATEVVVGAPEVFPHGAVYVSGL